MVGICECALDRIERCFEADAVFGHYTYEFGYGNYGVSIVELNGVVLAEVFEIGAVQANEVLHYIAAGCGRKEILLPEPQNFTVFGIVGGIEIFAYLLRLHAALRLIEAQDIYALTEHRHIIGHRSYDHIRKRYSHTLIIFAYAPRITKALPVVGKFLLETVLEVLLEQPVLIAYAVAVQRKPQSRGRIEKTCSKPAETAVAESGVLHLFKCVYIYALFREDGGNLMQDAEFHKVIIKPASHEVFYGEIMSAMPRLDGNFF